MQALVFDTIKEQWETSRGFTKVEVPEPTLDEKNNPHDARSVLIKMHYAGVCGSDRGIWYRDAFRDQILGSLKAEGKSYRIVGHESFGEVVDTGSEVGSVYKINKGDFVSCESHVVCNECFQCKTGQKNVCTNEKILGISHDGCFAEYMKVPARIVWKTDTGKIRPEVASVQEPFGNAVHAASKVDLKGKTIAIFGLGPIGLFLVLVARGMGASYVIGVDPNEKACEMARRLGIDYVIPMRTPHPTPSPLGRGERSEGQKPYVHDKSVIDEIMKITSKLGVDVAFEMAGPNASLNNAIFATRRGGDVILFGIKSGDFVLEDYNRLIVRGVTMHAVIGREVFATWETTRKLLEDIGNKVQEKIFKIILQEGKNTIIPITEYTKELFEEKMGEHPKLLLQF